MWSSWTASTRARCSLRVMRTPQPQRCASWPQTDRAAAVLGAQEHDRQQADYTIDAQVRGTDAVYRAAIASRSRRD